MCSCLGLLNNAFCFSLCVMSGMRSQSIVYPLSSTWLKDGIYMDIMVVYTKICIGTDLWNMYVFVLCRQSPLSSSLYN